MFQVWNLFLWSYDRKPMSQLKDLCAHSSKKGTWWRTTEFFLCEHRFTLQRKTSCCYFTDPWGPKCLVLPLHHVHGHPGVVKREWRPSQSGREFWRPTTWHSGRKWLQHHLELPFFIQIQVVHPLHHREPDMDLESDDNNVDIEPAP